MSVPMDMGSAAVTHTVSPCTEHPAVSSLVAGRPSAFQHAVQTEACEVEYIEDVTTSTPLGHCRKYEAQNRAVVLEMIGDLPEADSKPPTNMLFVCKLNQVTTEEVSLAVCKGRVWA